MEKFLTVKQAIRRKFPVIENTASLETAIHLMADKDVTVLAVKLEEELIGMITVSDVMQGLANDYDLKQTNISKFMTECSIDGKSPTAKSCIMLDEDQDAISAIKVMYEGGINHLLVTGVKNEPRGIVSNLDLVKLIASG